MLADIEALRRHLRIERWLVLGLSWGATLALVYAQQHPERVRGLVLGMVTAGTDREIRWITRDVGRLFPEAWHRFRAGVPGGERDGDLAAAYSRLLESGDPATREQAARDWCDWESSHVAFDGEPTPREEFADPLYRLAFARLVTHYWGNGCFLEDRQVFRDIDRLRGVPGALVHGRRDVSSPLDVAWEIAERWPDGQLTVVDEGAHSAQRGMGAALTAATDRFADLSDTAPQ